MKNTHLLAHLAIVKKILQGVNKMKALLTHEFILFICICLYACGSSSPASNSDFEIQDSGLLDSIIENDGASIDQIDPSDLSYFTDGQPADVHTSTDGNIKNACEDKKGICMTSDSACSSNGGTVAPEGNSGCDFDDTDEKIQITCCIPPTVKPQGDDCKSHGGICTFTPGGCYKTGGFLAPLWIACEKGSSGGSFDICCVPKDACPSNENLECCMGTWTAIPQCDRGKLVCPDGQSPVEKGVCSIK